MKKIIFINGHPCSGKTTIINQILERDNNFFHLNIDIVKRFWKSRSLNSDTKKIFGLVTDIASYVVKTGDDILMDGMSYEEIKSVASQFGYKILEYNLVYIYLLYYIHRI